MIVRQVVFYSAFFYGCVMDIRKKAVSNRYLFFFCILCFGLCLLQDDGNVLPQILMGCIPGALFLFLALITREQVGYGDGILICCLGMVLPKNIFYLGVSIALILLCLFSGIALLCHRVKRNSRIPLFPFLWVGCVVSQFLIFQ